jgi:hypothetical protein
MKQIERNLSNTGIRYFMKKQNSKKQSQMNATIKQDAEKKERVKNAVNIAKKLIDKTTIEINNAVKSL